MVFWLANFLATLNLLTAILSFFSKNDIAHLGLGAIYSIVIGPIFGLFRWRFRRGVRYVPAILFVSVCIYIILGVLGVSKKMMQGMTDGNQQFIALYLGYVIALFILGQSDFKLSFYMFGVFLVTDIILNISRKKIFDHTMEIAPQECHQFIDKLDITQEIKVGIIDGALIMVACYLQQVDVSLIYIKKWIMGRQQEQINSYF